MKIFLITLTSFLFLSCVALAKKPNFVYIMVDDAGYGDFSCFGQKKFKTPNVDRMAKGGMKLTDFYASSTVCAPSRSSLMTGHHSGRGYIRGNKEIKPEGQHPLPMKAVTIPEVLKQSGYVSGMFGKWGLGAPGTEGDPMNQGFDRFYGLNCQRQSHNFYPTHVWSDRKKVMLDRKHYSHTLIADECLKFIRVNKDNPFFCYVPFTIPHAAMQSPEKRIAPWRKKFPEFEKVTGKYGGSVITNPVAAFAAMMEHMDEDVGRILDLLEELKIDDNTLVIFTSDNGGEMTPDYQGWNGPWRGSYFTAKEGSLRVPYIVRWPGKVPAGKVSNEIVHQFDLYATVANITGGKVPTDRIIDSKDMTDFFLGKQEESGRDGFVVYVGNDIHGVKWQNYKMMFKEFEGGLGTGKLNVFPMPHFYDLYVDPKEEYPVTKALGGILWQRWGHGPILVEHEKSLAEEPPIKPGTPDPYVPAKK